jgi:hypothetical protein
MDFCILTSFICSKSYELISWISFIRELQYFYPMPEISDFQRTNSEFAKAEQKYPVKITLEYAHYKTC